MNSNNSQGKTTIEMMAYWYIKKYRLNLPHNLQGIFTPENLPETQKGFYHTIWKNRKPTHKHCTGTYSGISINCGGKVELGKLICAQCQNALLKFSPSFRV